MEVEVGRRFWRFHGGLKLRHWKKISIGRPMQFGGMPDTLVLPLKQHMGNRPTPAVKVGDRVLRWQCLTELEGSWGAHIHAPTSGYIRAIEEHPVPHPSGLSAPCIVLETDGEHRAVDPVAIPDWAERQPAFLARFVFESGVVGLGGAVFPTHIKLQPGKDRPVKLLIVNGAECEPYIACDEMLMRLMPNAMIVGSQIMAHILGADKCIIAIEDQMGAVEHILLNTQKELGIDDIDIIKIPTIYPEGGERQLVQVLTGLEVPRNGHPIDLGMVCLNVGTAVSIYKAVVEGKPLTERIVSVTGRGFAQPCNLQVMFGTAIKDLVDKAGGYTPYARRLIVGGPLMGIALPHDDFPIIKSTNCVLALTGRDIKPVAPELPCIRCGECYRVCPAQLLPQQLLWYINAENYDEVERHDLSACIECGCCAYVCPSQIPLVDYYRYAKHELRARKNATAKADHARTRLQAHDRRIEKQRAEHDAYLENRRMTHRPDDRKSEIQAAIARAKARKNDHQESLG